MFKYLSHTSLLKMKKKIISKSIKIKLQVNTQSHKIITNHYHKKFIKKLKISSEILQNQKLFVFPKSCTQFHQRSDTKLGKNCFFPNKKKNHNYTKTKQFPNLKIIMIFPKSLNEFLFLKSCIQFLQYVYPLISFAAWNQFFRPKMNSTTRQCRTISIF